MLAIVRAVFAIMALAFGASLPEQPLRPLVIVVDPGHGGEKSGAIGPGKLKEKDVSLAVAKRVASSLRAAGHEVLLTREEDVTVELSARIRLANERGAGIFLSIHTNSVPVAAQRSKILGLETYFLSADATDVAARELAVAENSDDGDVGKRKPEGVVGAILADLARTEAHADSSRLAYLLHGAMLEDTGAKDRGVRQAPFFVLEGATMPAVLVEVGYISHPEEASRLRNRSEQEKIARAITRGIEEFWREVLAKKSAAVR